MSPPAASPMQSETNVCLSVTRSFHGNIASVVPRREDIIISKAFPMTKISESKLLENETKDLLNRASGLARRCAAYKPTLKELTSVSFSDYVRGEVLGVPLPGWEFCYVYEDKNMRKVVTTCSSPVPTLSSEVRDDTATGDRHEFPPSLNVTIGPSLPATPKKVERTMRTRSKSREEVDLRKGPCTKLFPTKVEVPEPKKYQMCWYKLRDGMAKVSLPAGFWTKTDTTARGRLVSCIEVCFSFDRLL